jgi:hypothetical protein
MFDDVINQWDKNVYPEMLLIEHVQSPIRTKLRSTNREHLDANAVGQMQQPKL